MLNNVLNYAQLLADSKFEMFFHPNSNKPLILYVFRIRLPGYVDRMVGKFVLRRCNVATW